MRVVCCSYGAVSRPQQPVVQARFVTHARFVSHMRDSYQGMPLGMPQLLRYESAFRR